MSIMTFSSFLYVFPLSFLLFHSFILPSFLPFVLFTILLYHSFILFPFLCVQEVCTWDITFLLSYLLVLRSRTAMCIVLLCDCV